MASYRRPKRRGPTAAGGVQKRAETRSDADIFETLISAIESQQQGGTRMVHSLLLILSKKSSTRRGARGASALADVLFGALKTRFEELVSALLDAPARGRVGVRPAVDELALVLRCCMVLFDLLGRNLRVQFEKGWILLRVLRSLVPVELSRGNGRGAVMFRKFSPRGVPIDGELDATMSLVEITGPWYLYLVPVLEVFADELLMNKSTREKLMRFDSASSGSERLFKQQFGSNNIGCVLEVITSQFILSCSLSRVPQSSLDRQFYYDEMDFVVPELSLQSALILLLHPITISAPKVLQTYLISLAAKSVQSCLPSDDVTPESSITDCFLLALETSVSLYSRYMHGLHVEIHGLGSASAWKPLEGSFQQSFESFLQPDSMKILLSLTSNSKRTWDAASSNDMAFRTTHDLVANSVEYIKDNLCVFDSLYKDNIQPLVSWLLSQVSPDAVADFIMLKKAEMVLEDLVLLASILNLMSCSMLQVLRFGRHLKLSDSSNSTENVASSKASVVYSHSCFEQFGMNSSYKIFTSEFVDNECKRLLSYFSSLLPVSYPSQPGFLVKDCLYIMRILVHTFITEEGDLSELLSLFNAKMGCFSSNSSKELTSVLVVQEATSVTTKKARKIYGVYTRSRSLLYLDQENGDNQEEPLTTTLRQAEKTCRGDAFLKCVIGNRAKRLPDFDDLVDFVVCERGKDYSAWLKTQDKYRGWKLKKRQGRGWCQKKKIWKSIGQPLRPCLRKMKGRGSKLRSGASSVSQKM